jgi:hypothetical protein
MRQQPFIDRILQRHFRLAAIAPMRQRPPMNRDAAAIFIGQIVGDLQELPEEA